MLALVDNEVTLFLLKFFFISFTENYLIEKSFMKVIRIFCSDLARINFLLLLSENSYYFPLAPVFTGGKER